MERFALSAGVMLEQAQAKEGPTNANSTHAKIVNICCNQQRVVCKEATILIPLGVEPQNKNYGRENYKTYRDGDELGAPVLW